MWLHQIETHWSQTAAEDELSETHATIMGFTWRGKLHSKRDRTHVLLVNEVFPSADDGFLATGHLASCLAISGISMLGSPFALKQVWRKKNPKQRRCHVSVSPHGGILTSVAPQAAVPHTCTSSCRAPTGSSAAGTMETTLFLFGCLIRQHSVCIHPQRIYFLF